VLGNEIGARSGVVHTHGGRIPPHRTCDRRFCDGLSPASTDPAKLERLIKDLINAESWMALDADVKGDAYEGLLEKNAQDVKAVRGNTSRLAPSSGALSMGFVPNPVRWFAIPRAAQGASFSPHTNTSSTTTRTWTGIKRST
jgi:hypothetical protein